MIPLIIVISLFTIGTTCIAIDMIINPDIPVITVKKGTNASVYSEENEEDNTFDFNYITEAYPLGTSEEESLPIAEDYPLGEPKQTESSSLDLDSFVLGESIDFDVDAAEDASILMTNDDGSPFVDESMEEILSPNIEEPKLNDDFVLGNSSIFDDEDFNTIELDAANDESNVLNATDDSLAIDDSLVIDIDKKLMDYDIMFKDMSNKDLELE